MDAVDFKVHKPVAEPLALRVVRFSGPALVEGVDHHRNKPGVDVAIEALRDALRTRKATVDQIHRFAKLCRVPNVVRPYLESAV